VVFDATVGAVPEKVDPEVDKDSPTGADDNDQAGAVSFDDSVPEMAAP